MATGTGSQPNETLLKECLERARKAAAEFEEQTADTAYEEALAALGTDGKRDPRYLDILDEMARMLRLEDDGKAEAALLRRLAVQREVHGARSQQEAFELCYLASYYASENRRDDAIDTYRQALRVLSELGRPCDEVVAGLRQTVARLLTLRAPDAEADEAWELARESVAAAFGMDSTEMASVLFGMAQLRLEQARYDEAESLALQAIAIPPSPVADSVPPLSARHSLLAAIYHSHGRREEVAALRRTLEVMDTEPAGNPLALPAVLERLARALASEGDLDEAVSCYDRCVKAWNSAAWPIGARPELLDEYAAVLRRCGRTQAADALVRQAEYDRSIRRNEYDLNNGDELIAWLQRHGKGPESPAT